MNNELQRSSLDNSFEAREERKRSEKLDPIVKKSDVIVKKEPISKKVKKAFISDDAKDVTSYILFDIIVPGIKDGIFATLERMFYGSSSGYSSRDRDTYYGRDRVSYASYYKKRDSRERDRDRRDDILERDDRVDYRHIVLKRREDAENIVRTLRDYIHDYDQVSVARLLDLIDEPGRYTDNNYGWTRESDIGIKRTRGGGYLIDVPEAEYLGD